MIQNRSRWLQRNEILEAEKEKQTFENVRTKLPEGVEMNDADAGVSI